MILNHEYNRSYFQKNSCFLQQFCNALKSLSFHMSALVNTVENKKVDSEFIINYLLQAG